ncbi:uncharacterized protein LOC113385765 [Ctenocephalides felis]|uniref:uncharacterized protein LOC113385765 n=1 Tax=Ctenocephalides felis TaxID=7515 RepID=UPI000E6E50A7|nr:uncharacterized protein LOC113385765 [Ctenocephalides felis]
MDFIEAIIEYRPRLQSCHVFLKFNSIINKNDINIIVLNNSIEINYIGNHKNMASKIEDIINLDLNKSDAQFHISLDTSDHFTLNKLSLSGLIYSGNEITFRLQTEPKEQNKGSFKTELITDLWKNYLTENDAYKINICKQTPYEISCRKCNHAMFSTQGFSRILELPRENIDMSDWFCHKHNNQSKTFAMEPEIDALFYKDNCIVINNKIFTNHQIENSNTILCSNCKTNIGSKKMNTIEFYNFAIGIKTESNNIFHIFSYDNCLYEIAVQDFIHLTKKRISDNSILLMPQYILLKIVDVNAQVLKSDKKGVLTLKNTLKLMYKIESEYDEVRIQWEKNEKSANNIIECIPYELFTSASKHLQMMSEFIPISCKFLNGFTLSYLDL